MVCLQHASHVLSEGAQSVVSYFAPSDDKYYLILSAVQVAATLGLTRYAKQQTKLVKNTEELLLDGDSDVASKRTAYNADSKADNNNITVYEIDHIERYRRILRSGLRHTGLLCVVASLIIGIRIISSLLFNETLFTKGLDYLPAADSLLLISTVLNLVSNGMVLFTTGVVSASLNRKAGAIVAVAVFNFLAFPRFAEVDGFSALKAVMYLGSSAVINYKLGQKFTVPFDDAAPKNIIFKNADEEAHPLKGLVKLNEAVVKSGRTKSAFFLFNMRETAKHTFYTYTYRPRLFTFTQGVVTLQVPKDDASSAVVVTYAFKDRAWKKMLSHMNSKSSWQQADFAQDSEKDALLAGEAAPSYEWTEEGVKNYIYSAVTAFARENVRNEV